MDSGPCHEIRQTNNLYPESSAEKHDAVSVTYVCFNGDVDDGCLMELDVNIIKINKSKSNSRHEQQ